MPEPCEKDGLKVAYNRIRALSAMVMYRRQKLVCNAYQCPHCHWWHLAVGKGEQAK